jgi:hypothetical protein
MIYGEKVLTKDLERNDLFLFQYGFKKMKFRVNESFGENGLMAHSLNWCKSNSTFIEGNEEVIYLGKMNSIRSLFLL